MDVETKKLRRERRRKKIRAKIKGTANRPRIVVFRSNRHFYLQAIDDETSRVICQVSDLKLKTRVRNATLKVAQQVGMLMAKQLKARGIKQAVFDRAGYKYHGQVKIACEQMRRQGIKI